MDVSLLTLFPDLPGDSLPPRTTGILPSQRIQEFIQAGYISASTPISADQVQPASLDLRLGALAYRVRASFLPGRKSTVLSKANEFKTHEIDLSKPSVLERGCVYIVPLMEEWNLPERISGKANPKSTTGRLDIFARLITDYSNEFERVAAGYKGRLYAEIVPRTFSILVQSGTRLNQVRFIRGTPLSSDSALSALHEQQTLLYAEGGAIKEPQISDGLWISVDLEGSE